MKITTLVFALCAVGLMAVGMDPALASDPVVAGISVIGTHAESVAQMIGLAVGGFTVQQMREKRETAVTRMGELLEAAGAEDRDLSAEELTEYDALKSEASGLKARIERAEEQAALEADLNAVQPGVARRAGPTQRPAGDPAKREFESLGEFLHAVRFNPNDQRLSYSESAGRSAEQRMDDGESGGFAVPQQFRGELLEVETSAAVVRPRANVIPAGSPPDASITMPALDQSESTNMYGGVEVNWIGEGGEKQKTTAKLREIKLTPHEVAAHIKVTDKLLRNWQAAEGFLGTLLRKAMMSAEDTAFLRGNGVAKPLGFIGSDAALAVNREAANTVSYEDIIAMEERLFGMGGVFIGSKRLKGQLRRLEDSEGHLIFQENAREGAPSILLGKPFIESDRVPALGAKGDLALATLEHYLIKDGSGPFVAASEHANFTENKTVIKAFWNVDGQPWLKGPIKTENGDVQSPFIVLDVPSA